MATIEIDTSSLSLIERISLIRMKILRLTPEHPTDLARTAAAVFGISRQTAHKHIRALMTEGLLQAEGNTKARRYSLRNQVDTYRLFTVTPELEEDRVWRSFALPHLSSMGENVKALCHYGFTEMVNNVIDHSESSFLILGIKINALMIRMEVSDTGVGIFAKIQEAFDLEDPRHALLEMSKGRLTTDPSRHTGEGVYFTSRMFDEFAILSSDLFFKRTASSEDEWLMETETRDKTEGTFISLEIERFSNRRLEQVFSEASTEEDDFRFSRTHFPVSLARYGDELLVSRSQAKRVLARFEKFSEVILDFSGVDEVGQAFTDEIFRVFQQANPSTLIVAANASPAINRMIDRVKAAAD